MPILQDRNSSWGWHSIERKNIKQQENPVSELFHAQDFGLDSLIVK